MENRFIREINVDWRQLDKNSYLHQIPAIRSLHNIVFDDNITFFSGENGTGKTTLLQAIAVSFGLNAEGGTANYYFETYHTQSELSTALKIVKGFKRPQSSFYYRAESFFNVATKAEEYDQLNPYGPSFGGKNLHEQSHGEGALSFFQSFKKPGLYLMDEPEAALSPQRQLSLFVHIAQMAKNGAQFIIATHSPILLALPGKILSFDQGQICPCTYEETESYRITDLFVRNREGFLRQLLMDIPESQD